MNDASKEKLSIIRQKGFYLSTPSGTSMLPMLAGGVDQAVIVALPGKAKKGDVLLYEDKDGQNVLHRVIKVKSDGYLLRGDNRYYTEFVPFDRIIGILTSYFKGEKQIDCKKSLRYRFYTQRRMLFYPVRRAFAAVLRRLRRRHTRRSP